MLDRERADFYRALGQMQEQLSERCVAVHLPIGSEHELTGDRRHPPHVLVREPGRRQGAGARPDSAGDGRRRRRIPREAARRGRPDRRGADGEVPRGGGAGVEEVAHALKDAVTRGEVFPVACGVATKNLGTHALLDLIVEGGPSPAKAGSITHIEGAETAAFVFKTIADPFAGRINLFRGPAGLVRPDQTLVDARTHAKERWARCSSSRARSTSPPRSSTGRHRRRREAEGGADGRPSARQGGRDGRAGDRLPGAGDELCRDHRSTRATRRKSAAAIRRLAEEDPTLGCAATSRPGRRSSPE